MISWTALATSALPRVGVLSAEHEEPTENSIERVATSTS
jgi:hypothetical protein